MNKVINKLTILIFGIYLITQIQTTSAGFVDSENTTDNSQKSGSVDLVLSNNLSPVDTKIAGEIKYLNGGTVPFVYDQSYKVSGVNCGDKDIKIEKDFVSIYSGPLLLLDGFSYLEINEIKHEEEDIYVIEVTPQNGQNVDLTQCIISIDSKAWQVGLGQSVGFHDSESALITNLLNPLGLSTFLSDSTDDTIDVDMPSELTETPTPTPFVTPTTIEDDPPAEPTITPTPTLEPTITPEVTPTPTEIEENTST